MKEDSASDSWFTTMIDLYGLPSDFPGFSESRRLADPIARVRFLEGRFANDIGHQRFVPYIQLHEFEALLFTDPQSFAVAFPGIGAEFAKLEAIRQQFGSPELIDDGPDTCPSKRMSTDRKQPKRERDAYYFLHHCDLLFASGAEVATEHFVAEATWHFGAITHGEGKPLAKRHALSY